MHTFQKMTFSVVDSTWMFSICFWVSSLLLGPWCLLLPAACPEAWDPRELFLMDFPSVRPVNPALVRGDTTPNPSPHALHPSHRGTAHTQGEELCHEHERNLFFTDIGKITHQPPFEC